jgi:TnsA endonuclease N terminal/TnsA endonuclease C terminal
MLEHDFIVLCEFDDLVATITEQPVCIDAAGSKYTPDFLVTYVNHAKRPPMLVEIKYREDLRDQWTELHPRLRAGFRFARSTDRTFKILTEIEIQTTCLDNLIQLWRYRSAKVAQEDASLIISAVERAGRTTPEEVLDGAGVEGECRANLLFVIWHLLAIGKLEADLDNTPLSNFSAIWMSHGIEH